VKKLIKIALGAALPVFLAAGCSDYLKGGMLTNNPNSPVQGSASNAQLFVSIQTNNFIFQEGDMGRATAQWMQQLIGVQRQQVTIYNYSGITNASYDGEFQRPYGGGGLLDLRTLEASTLANNDLKYLGVAQIMEAWMIGTTADVWGDIPYSQAANYATYPTPQLDAQADVYTAVETLLDQALTNLAGAGAGPGTADLVYGGNIAKWTALAHTLKARFYLHQAEVSASNYALALAQANQGIAANTGDYLAYHVAGLQLSMNTWYQFMDANGGTGRAGDLVAAVGAVHSTLWDTLSTRADPRFAEYFDVANTGGGEMSAYRLSGGYRQPLVTYNENLLIIAEATLGSGGTAAAALTALNAEQTAWNTATTWHTARAVPLSATATVHDIMTEKWITLFQNIESWNDWKRTCQPNLTPVSTLAQFGNRIPSRMFYGASEENTNPNIPPVGTAPNGAFNSNDPNAC